MEFKTLILILLNICTILPFVRNISFVMDSYKKNTYCFYKNVMSAESVKFSFVLIGGYHHDKCNVFFYDPNEKLLHGEYNTDKVDFNSYAAVHSGYHKLCFQPLSKGKLHVNFEFEKSSELTEAKELAKDGIIILNNILLFVIESIRDMQKELIEIGEILNIIDRNTRFLNDRKHLHTNMITRLTDAVSTYSYIKAFIIISISIMQIYVVVKIFGQDDNKINFRRDNNIYL
jgi:hypothetical protein